MAWINGKWVSVRQKTVQPENRTFVVEAENRTIVLPKGEDGEITTNKTEQA